MSLKNRSDLLFYISKNVFTQFTCSCQTTISSRYISYNYGSVVTRRTSLATELFGGTYNGSLLVCVSAARGIYNGWYLQGRLIFAGRSVGRVSACVRMCDADGGIMRKGWILRRVRLWGKRSKASLFFFFFVHGECVEEDGEYGL